MQEIFKGIKNLIFDFGGVVFDIDPQRAVEAFKKIGVSHFGNNYHQLENFGLFEKFETGKINAANFREEVRKLANINLSDKSIDDAWTSMLTGMPAENARILKRLGTKYRMLLLSNTNEIHCKFFEKKIAEENGIPLKELFEKTHYSHELGCRKPGLEIYDKVLKNNNLIPNQTLFIDDSEKNISGAQKAGLNVLHLKKPLKLADVFTIEVF